MRIAALYDIHGNLPALEAVLDEVAELSVDRIVVGGDVVPGPMPEEILTALRNQSLPVDAIQGNGDHDVLEMLAGREVTRVPEAFRDIVRWSGEALTDDSVAEIGRWPAVLRFEVPGLGQVLFCHATPRDDNEIFTRLTPEERLHPIFEEADADVVVCGHTHMQFDRAVGTTRVVNAGSVGMPFADPGAYWLLLGPEIELRRTSYDLDAAAARIRATDYPQAEGFVSDYVLSPPSEETMLEMFEKAALG